MKIFFMLAFIISTATIIKAQDFKTDLANARTNYASGKLSDAHYNIEQAMQELDLIVGKEVLKILPAKIDTLNVNTGDDQVMSNSGFLGANIHRSYGQLSNMMNNAGGKSADISIVTNSPLISGINTFLNTPILGGMMTSDASKSIKVQGYKARLEKSNGSMGQIDYSIEVPLSNTLITFKVTNTTDTEILNLVNTIPLQQIAKLLQ
ncbi:MAG TPA: hypothetical protein VHB48_03930 [Chitinophagaceae bacterium]|nr:hypothetical protein [Chitinophagaceae bacterium]